MRRCRDCERTKICCFAFGLVLRKGPESSRPIEMLKCYPSPPCVLSMMKPSRRSRRKGCGRFCCSPVRHHCRRLHPADVSSDEVHFLLPVVYLRRCTKLDQQRASTLWIGLKLLRGSQRLVTSTHLTDHVASLGSDRCSYRLSRWKKTPSSCLDFGCHSSCPVLVPPALHTQTR